MGYDLKRSHFSQILEKHVASGSTVVEEGVCLVATLDATTGEEVVAMSAGAEGEVLAGFAIRDNADHATTSVVEEGTVPTAPAALTITLANNNIKTTDGGHAGNLADMRVECPVGTELTKVDGAVAGNGEVAVEPTTGVLVFHSDESATAYRVTYRYNLTVAEARLTFFQRNINNEAGALFGQLGVGMGIGEIYTDMFNNALDWSAGTLMHTGAGGLITQGGTGMPIDARVIHVPDVANPMLGISFNVGGREITPV
jgi:hypothetical protein